MDKRKINSIKNTEQINEENLNKLENPESSCCGILFIFKIISKFKYKYLAESTSSNNFNYEFNNQSTFSDNFNYEFNNSILANLKNPNLSFSNPTYMSMSSCDFNHSPNYDRYEFSSIKEYIIKDKEDPNNTKISSNISNFSTSSTCSTCSSTNDNQENNNATTNIVEKRTLISILQ